MNEGLAHLLGDYVVQSDWMATEKTKQGLPAAAHAVTYAACFLPLTRDPRALGVIGGTHYLIDRYRLARHLQWFTSQFAPKEHRPGHTPTGLRADAPDWLAVWLLFITDNTVHMLINHHALRIGKRVRP